MLRILKAEAYVLNAISAFVALKSMENPEVET